MENRYWFIYSFSPLLLLAEFLMLFILSFSLFSSRIGESLGIKGDIGFIAADTERSSLILCGKAIADANGIREALSALSEPIIISRGGLPLSAR